jgi:DNA transformation protein
MFCGAGLYRDGKVFGLVADNVAYLKVDETNKDKFLVAGSSPFKPFPNKPTILSYFDIPPDVLENLGELIEWADESLSIQKKWK